MKDVVKNQSKPKGVVKNQSKSICEPYNDITKAHVVKIERDFNENYLKRTPGCMLYKTYYGKQD